MKSPKLYEKNYGFFFWCLFCDISILLVSCWGPMETTFLSWILSDGLFCAHKLTASNLKHKDACFQLQTLFLYRNIVRQI